MTDEERRIITEFVGRVAAAEGDAIDPAADRLIADLQQQHPEARYRLAQLAFFQEHALAEAQNHVRKLEFELQQARSQRSSGGLFGGLLGGGNARPTGAPPAPVHAPNYRPGMFDPNQQPPVAAASPWGRGAPAQRGGFMAGAAQTAIGVMGGMILGSMLADALGFGGGEAAAAEAPAEPAAYDDGFDTAGMEEEEF